MAACDGSVSPVIVPPAPSIAAYSQVLYSAFNIFFVFHPEPDSPAFAVRSFASYHARSHFLL